MKRINKKCLLMLVMSLLLLTVSVSGTLAFIIDKTDSITNTFTPTNVDIEIPEEKNENSKTSIAIKNNGNIDVYVRAKLVGYYVDDAGNIVAPWTDGVAYNTTDWKNIDGYWYYKTKVAPGAATENLLASIYTYPVQDGMKLVIDVLAQAIQAEPDSAVQEAWGVTAAQITQ